MAKPLKYFYKKKSLGQHFLQDEEVAEKISEALQPLNTIDSILEIGPGLGILTKYLLKIPAKKLFISEIDERSIYFLKNELGLEENKIFHGDFLKLDLGKKIAGDVAVIGNFPYNISSQILFKILDNKENVPLLVGMFQREVAKRITASKGNKDYGILSVFLQTIYNSEYLFDVSPEKFDPQPKVYSAVIRLTRKLNFNSDYNEILFKKIVKLAFNQRRKKLSNALREIEPLKNKLIEFKLADKRAEELTVNDFIQLTKSIA